MPLLKSAIYPAMLLLVVAMFACHKKGGDNVIATTKPTVQPAPTKDSNKVKIDSTKVVVPVNHRHIAAGEIIYPYADTFFGVWHDVSSGDLPNGDTTFNTWFYVKHIRSDSSIVPVWLLL